MKNIIYSETRYIKSKTHALRNEKLSFKGGQKLGDLSIGIEDNATLRMVRRIVEKRVCQDYYKNHPHVNGNARYATRRHKSNAIRNLYGWVPVGFKYCCAA